MMPREDQAAGLRRLLHHSAPQVVSVATFGTEALRWLALEARACAAAGRQTVVLDEVSACGSNLMDVLALPARFDLLQAVDRHVRLEAVCIDAGDGLTLYPAARMARALVGADRILAARFAETCQRLQRADLWLVHARIHEDFVLSPLAVAAHRLVVVVEGSARSVTAAYTLLKQLAGGPWLQIDVALAGRRDDEASALVTNLGETFQAQTGLALRRVERLEASAAVAAMASDEQERERFPERVLGFARRGSRTLALGV